MVDPFGIGLFLLMLGNQFPPPKAKPKQAKPRMYWFVASGEKRALAIIDLLERTGTVRHMFDYDGKNVHVVWRPNAGVDPDKVWDRIVAWPGVEFVTIPELKPGNIAPRELW